MPNAIERQVAGRYLLRDKLGKGGMGTVWKATDSVLKRDVAVKEVKLPAALSSDASDAVRKRVMREAQTAARLSHPGAVTVFDVVEEDGHTFIVMELVDAPSLDDLVKRDGPLPPERVAQIGLEVLAALEAAHLQGITHRDVKPGNVMIPPDGRAKLADFGIASVKGDPKLTATGLILGSPSYMAPEQASKDIAGPESDLWALGATLYYAVEGVPPFERGQAIPTLTAVVHEDPRPMERAAALQPAISALLVKEPAQRPDASELRRMLEQVKTRGNVSTSAATAMAPAATATMIEDEPVATRSEPEPVRRREPLHPQPDRDGKPWLVWLGALVLVALLAAFIIPNLGEDDPAGDERPRPNKKNQAAQKPEQNENDENAGEGDDPSITEDEESDPGEGGGAEGFNTYTDSAVGYTISYPSDWDAVPLGDTRTDFKEPASRRYLRIDYTTSPGEDAYGHIDESLEPNFSNRYPDYQRVQLTKTSFAGTDNAALWEYTYKGQHAYNLQFVTTDREYGFALNFQTPEGEWEDSQALWESFKESFEVP